jgi:4-methylaminobutanoate oxidase (formaldehyde-forming)
MPTHARVVIIGGGIAGCSVAYHLTRLGWRDVVVLEQNQITSGTTWHAAGLVGQLRSSYNVTRLAAYAVELYPRLEAETGQATGFKQNGAITVARTTERLIELKRLASMAKCFGVEVEVIAPPDVARLYPLARTDDLVGAVLIPKDGQVNPVDATVALAKGARMGGARIVEGVRVTKIETAHDTVVGVQTTAGRIGCAYIVLCGGMWSRDLARTVGVTVPLHACEHMYVVTEELAEVPPTLPVLRDYDGYIYVKEDAGKLLVGGFEPVAKPWGMDGLPTDRPYLELGEDWDHFAILLESALHRLPILHRAGIRTFMNGPESFTPDTRFMMGEAPEVANFYVAAGFNSIGIASAPGVGRALAEWIVGGAPPMDLWDVDIRRFEPFQATAQYLRERVVEAMGLLYAMHWPYRQPATARGARRLPHHDRLAARGACFGVVAGWERPLFYAPPGTAPDYGYTYGPQTWWPYAAEEARATQEGVALYDLSTFGKFLLEGPDAAAVLQHLCANDVAREVGRVVYTQMLTPKGGIAFDGTVVRLAEDRFLISGSSFSRTHDYHHLRRHIPPGTRVHLSDVTNTHVVLGLMGPRSRELLGRVSGADLSNAAFPFSASRDIEVGYAPVRAQRISYVGELGWELWVPVEFAVHVYDRLVAAGESMGLRHAGLHCMDALRLEKGYKLWGHDMSIDETPLEVGLRFAVAFDKGSDFLGRAALLRQQAEGLRKQLLIFTIDDGAPLLLHAEPIYRDGVLVGRTTSGGMGFRIGRAIAMGLVHNDAGITRAWIRAGTWAIEVAGERYPATIHLTPPYDPQGERMRV